MIPADDYDDEPTYAELDPDPDEITALRPEDYWAQVEQRGRSVGDDPIGETTEWRRRADARASAAFPTTDTDPQENR